MSDYKKCLYCAEEILQAANKCKHCGARLTPVTFAESAVSAVGETISEGFNIIWTVLIVCLVLFFMMWGCVASI